QQVMRSATKYGVPVYPVSQGKNWGYGSRVPERSGIVLSLASLHQIMEMDWDRGIVRLQPGVSFSQLQD
ncbi:MAG TPA: hypothetical protein DCE41_13735, partial [Cytophagales bacterium]|nr:hypothetical protein [Cytophagales bacterium]